MSGRIFPKSLKELRIHFSQNSPASRGLRDFIIKAYPEMKKSNPGFPILIREASGVESRIIARFGTYNLRALKKKMYFLAHSINLFIVAQGQERKIVVDSIGASDVEQKFNALVSEAK
ncbi:hypothetical protein IWW36_002940 [Coemansia brasiliensis]|uniref:Ribosomal protein/NADH dehydrogenase domain-containing protein n=1 Tax=Coemansia brasiliensis TaxID=2650707 RepID=A0A9W8I685_9FUNG|nr:hypothetical protein IWW36_002940 [Coemansia brasiliensis]